MGASLHTALSLVEEDRDEIARRWLLEAVRQTPFADVPGVPVDRIVRDLPALISRIVRLAGAGAGVDERAELRQLGRELGRLRAPEGASPAEAARDVVLIHGEIAEALVGRSPGGPAATTPALAWLNRSLAQMVEAAVVDAEARAPRGRPDTATPAGEAVDRAEEPLDPLTRLPGRAHVIRELRHRSVMQRKHAQAFAVLLADIDGLDRVNAAFGRAAGDAALVRMADILRITSRAIDTVGRVGEDELCLVAPDHGAAGARALAARVEAAVAQIELPGGSRLQASAAGVACPEHGVEPETLLEAAETALYRVKAAGSQLPAR